MNGFKWFFRVEVVGAVLVLALSYIFGQERAIALYRAEIERLRRDSIQIQTGARGGKYVILPDGRKIYLKNQQGNNNEYPVP